MPGLDLFSGAKGAPSQPNEKATAESTTQPSTAAAADNQERPGTSHSTTSTFSFANNDNFGGGFGEGFGGGFDSFEGGGFDGGEFEEFGDSGNFVDSNQQPASNEDQGASTGQNGILEGAEANKNESGASKRLFAGRMPPPKTNTQSNAATDKQLASTTTEVASTVANENSTNVQPTATSATSISTASEASTAPSTIMPAPQPQKPTQQNSSTGSKASSVPAPMAPPPVVKVTTLGATQNQSNPFDNAKVDESCGFVPPAPRPPAVTNQGQGLFQKNGATTNEQTQLPLRIDTQASSGDRILPPAPGVNRSRTLPPPGMSTQTRMNVQDHHQQQPNTTLLGDDAPLETPRMQQQQQQTRGQGNLVTPDSVYANNNNNKNDQEISPSGVDIPLPRDFSDTPSGTTLDTSLTLDADSLMMEEETFDQLLAHFQSDGRDATDLLEKGDAELLDLSVEFSQAYSTILRQRCDAQSLLDGIEKATAFADNLIGQYSQME